MPNRKHKLVTNEYYHIYNRGVDKRDIFSDEDDVERFLESMIIFNQIKPTASLRDQREIKGVKNFLNHPGVELLGRNGLVDIVSFCILPNHFHILLRQKVDNGISEYMRRILGGYTNYFNSKYDRSGALFQGKFKSKLCGGDLYFKLLFCYTTFNFKVHDISKDGTKFVRSSWDEYISKKFSLVSEKEANFVLDIFQNMSKVTKYAKEIISVIRRKRVKLELNEDDFETE
jgi:putative transposase